jgi:hypothetical protein
MNNRSVDISGVRSPNDAILQIPKAAGDETARKLELDNESPRRVFEAEVGSPANLGAWRRSVPHEE